MQLPDLNNIFLKKCKGFTIEISEMLTLSPYQESELELAYILFYNYIVASGSKLHTIKITCNDSAHWLHYKIQQHQQTKTLANIDYGGKFISIHRLMNLRMINVLFVIFFINIRRLSVKIDGLIILGVFSLDEHKDLMCFVISTTQLWKWVHFLALLLFLWFNQMSCVDGLLMWNIPKHSPAKSFSYGIGEPGTKLEHIGYLVLL